MAAVVLVTQDVTNKQGMKFPITHNGVNLILGGQKKRLILASLLTNVARIYYTLDVAGIQLTDTTDLDAALELLYPYLDPGESLTVEHPSMFPAFMHLRTPNGATAELRVAIH